jgi:hypothetical protein
MDQCTGGALCSGREFVSFRRRRSQNPARPFAIQTPTRREGAEPPRSQNPVRASVPIPLIGTAPRPRSHGLPGSFRDHGGQNGH